MPNNSQRKCKAHLAVKGFGKKKYIDFEEIFSPLIKMSFFKVALGLDVSMKLEIEQLDVKIAFLQCDLEEEIYMKQLKGFTTKGKEHLLC